jgi:hypothetical protein
MHKPSLSIVVGALISIAPIAPIAFLVAQASSAVAAKRVASPDAIEGVSFTEVTGKIQSVSRAAREVMIADKSGGKAKFVVGPEAKNFASLNAGDDVRVRTTREVFVGPMKRGAASGAAEAQAAARAAAAPAHRMTVVASVVKVDDKRGVVQLKGPQGNLVEVQVQDRAKLARLKADEQVTLVYTDAVSVAVLPVH